MWYTKTSKDIKQTACVASWMTEQTAGRAKRLVWKLVRNLYANKKKKKSHQISEATSPSLIKCQKHQQPPLPFLRKWFKICKWRWLSRALSSRKKKKEALTFIFFQRMHFFFFFHSCFTLRAAGRPCIHRFVPLPGEQQRNQRGWDQSGSRRGGRPAEFSLTCFVWIQSLSSKLTLRIIET